MNKKFRKVKFLDLGCGKDKKEGYFGIDISALKGVDMVHDLNKGIPFQNNSIEKIFTKHFLEHVNNPLFLIEEMYRVLKKGGKTEIIVPHWSWYGSYTFMHRRFFHSLDFYFLEPNNPSNYYTKAKFKVMSVKLNWGKERRNVILRCLNKFSNFILNLNLNISENLLVKIFSPKEIRVVLKKV
jgi:predicted SAM-dependent methyltransferase